MKYQTACNFNANALLCLSIIKSLQQIEGGDMTCQHRNHQLEEAWTNSRWKTTKKATKISQITSIETGMLNEIKFSELKNARSYKSQNIPTDK